MRIALGPPGEGKLTRSKVEKVDQTMDSIREQMDLTNEISDAISNPVGMGNMVDEVGLGIGMSLDRTELLIARTSSRPSWRRWSRKSWTTDWQVPTVYRYTRPLPPWASQTAGNVSCCTLLTFALADV